MSTIKSNVMAILFASEKNNRLNELTNVRTIASLPFGGRYRLIDFPLSNLVNGGVNTIGIITRNNYSSLMDHIRSGRDWDLNRKNSGIAIFPPFVVNSSTSMYRGVVDALYAIRPYFRGNKEEYVIIGPSNLLSNINIEELCSYHMDKNADITMVTYKTEDDPINKTMVKVDKDNKIQDMLLSVIPTEKNPIINSKMYVIKKDLLTRLVEEAYARGQFDFEKDVILKNIKSLNVYAYELTGYVKLIDNIHIFYKANMDMLNIKKRKDLLGTERKIFTKVKDSPPTIYRQNAQIKNSLIADGCDIDGSVENCIIFRNVKIEKGAKVKNSIIMQDTLISENAQLDYVIADKKVVISKNKKLFGDESYPSVIVKGKRV